MRLLCLVDERAQSYGSVPRALEKLRELYAGILPVTWTIEYRNFDGIKWVPYFTNPEGFSDYGVDWARIQTDTREIWNRHGYAFDCVVYFIHPDNWYPQDSPVAGWNLGAFYNNYQVQLVRAKDIPNIEFTLKMEIFHNHNEFVYRELGVDLAKVYGVKDFDEDIVHGLAYGTLSQEKAVALFGRGYTKWEYRIALEKVKDLLDRTFGRRMKRYQLTLFQKLLVIYRGLLLKATTEPHALYENHSH